MSADHARGGGRGGKSARGEKSARGGNPGNNIRNERGKQAEALALAYLQGRRLRLLHQNYRSRYGEIDLVMHDAACIVFVEVRYRQDDGRLHPTETIDPYKQERIVRAARRFTQLHQEEYPEHDYRFDVIAVTGALGKPRIDWIQNAFGA